MLNERLQIITVVIVSELCVLSAVNSAADSLHARLHSLMQPSMCRHSAAESSADKTTQPRF